MAGERVTLVLGGGGMKGLAHVGAWHAVLDAGYEVTRVVGTSIGSLIGACIAGRMEVERVAGLARAVQKPDIVVLNRWALLFNGIRQQNVFRGDTFRTYVDSVLPVTTFEELALPLSINAVDLETGRLEWFGAGGRSDVPLSDAVYASCALPVFYPPAQIDGRFYVDGGVCDALPVDRARELGSERVIAVDVAAGPVSDAADVAAKGMVAIHHRVMQIMGYGRKLERMAGSEDPDVVYIRPELDGYSTFDFASTEYFLEEGYRAAQLALGGGEGLPGEAAS